MPHLIGHMNKTLQIKLPARTLLGCYNMKEKLKGKVPLDASLEILVATCTMAFVEWAVQQKFVPDINEEHAASILREMNISTKAPPWPSVKEALASKEELDEITEGIVKKIKVPAKVEEPPRVELPEGIRLDLSDSLIPFAILQQQCPKDALIEYAAEQKLLDAQEAISIVYSQVPVDVWGTAKARKLVEQVIKFMLQSSE